MAFSLLQSLIKNTIKVVGDGLTGGTIPIGSFAAGLYEDWCRGGSDKSASNAPPPPPTPAAQAQLRAELEKIAQDQRAFRQEVETKLAEMKELSEATRQAAATILNQIPGRIQASMRRPDDPTGRTVPPGLVLKKADDFKQFLPDKMPRFKAGDKAVLGTDLVVEELLGVGGFGEVWKAVHKSRPHAPPVALKFCTDEQAARTLRKEVELLDRVANQGRHKGIVELKYAHLEGDTPCLEYEYIDGGDLAGLITEWHASGKAAPAQLTKVMYMLAASVGYAHRLKPPIVHRDLKPQNVLTTRQEGKLLLKVADFGIGGLAAEQTINEWASETQRGGGQLTQSAGTCTPLYASPQQRRFGPPDPRDDVYALGVIWYQMLAGDVTKEPPRGGSWKRKFTEQGTPAEAIALLERCLEDDPAERPSDAQHLAEAIAKIVKGTGSEAKSSESAPAAPTPPPAKEQWHYIRDGQQAGPVSFDELKKLASSGNLGRADLVWTDKLSDWVEAATVHGLMPNQPVPPTPRTAAPNRESSEVDQALDPLSSKERDAIHMYYVEGRTYDEISRALGIPANDIGPLLKKARQAMRQSPQQASAASAPVPPANEQWYYSRDGQQTGPVSLAELKEFAKSGRLDARDLVWTEKLGDWVEAATIEGLCPKLPPAPPPGPRSTTAQIEFFIPPSSDTAGNIARTVAKTYVKIYSLGMLGGKITGQEIFKFYIDARLVGEGPVKDGFRFHCDAPTGQRKLEIALWKGGKEIDRKGFDLQCAKPGEYEVRFNFVRSTLGGMGDSSIEILRDPDFRSAAPSTAPAASKPANAPPASTGTAQLHFFLPAKQGFFSRVGQKNYALKVYSANKLFGEGNAADGFDVRRDLPTGAHSIDVVCLVGGAEKTRKSFPLRLTKAGAYEVRFNFVIDAGVFSSSMDKSHIDVLSEPD